MAAKDAGASKKKRKRYGWRTPRWRDPWFWAAVGLATLAVAGQVWVNPRLAWTDWAGLGLRAILTWVLISAIIRIRINLPRGLVDGFAEAEAKAQAKPSGRSTGESIARTSGRTVGRALGAYRRASGKD